MSCDCSLPCLSLMDMIGSEPQLSYQKEIVLPLPTSQRVHHWNRAYILMSYFHKKDSLTSQILGPCLFGMCVQIVVIIEHHKEPGWVDFTTIKAELKHSIIWMTTERKILLEFSPQLLQAYGTGEIWIFSPFFFSFWSSTWCIPSNSKYKGLKSPYSTPITGSPTIVIPHRQLTFCGVW